MNEFDRVSNIYDGAIGELRDRLADSYDQMSTSELALAVIAVRLDDLATSYSLTNECCGEQRYKGFGGVFAPPFLLYIFVYFGIYQSLYLGYDKGYNIIVFWSNVYLRIIRQIRRRE